MSTVNKYLAIINISLILISLFLAINQFKGVKGFSLPPSGPDLAVKWRNDVVSNLKIQFNASLNFEHRRNFMRAIGFWNSTMAAVTFRGIVTTGGNIIINPTNNTKVVGCGAVTRNYRDPLTGYITYSEIRIWYDPACVSDRRWWLAVATHELGHALGLGHMKYEPFSIMGNAWDSYRLPIPLLDDILALLYLYGPKKPNPVKFWSKDVGDYVFWGPYELNYYPYQLWTNTYLRDSYVFASLTSTSIYLSSGTYSSLGAMMIANIRYIEGLLYQGGIGFFTYTNPTILSSKVFEFTISRVTTSTGAVYAEFRLTYGSSSSYPYITVIPFARESFDASNDAGYLLILAVFHWEDGYTYAVAVAYKGTDVLGYVNFDKNVRYYQYFAWFLVYLYPAFAVWTDANTYFSKYQFDFVYTQYSS
jgi:hypothetical protein